MDGIGDNSTFLWLGAWALSALIAAGWFVAVRRLPVGDGPGAAMDPAWRERPLFFRLAWPDRASLGILAAIFVLLWLGRRDFFPIPPDGYYHLLAVRKILDTGTVPLWNDWEFAPAGRPHLYPPLYHLLVALVARLHGGDLVAAFQDVQCFVLPLAHASVWWLARWLFGARRALATLLLAGADPLLAITGMTASPSVLSGALVALMLLLFAARHWAMAAGMGALAFYMHTGLVPLAVAGIAVWCVWNREPMRPLACFLALLGLLAAPWVGWLLWHRDSFAHPIDLGLYGNYPALARPFLKLAWLQLFNVGLALVVGVGLWRARWVDPRNHLILACALAHLPLLASYGGRYFAHTVHLWAIFGGLALAPLLAAPVRKRALAACTAFALAPAVVVVGFGTVIPPGPIPLPSAWWFPPLAAGGGVAHLEHGEALGLFPYADAREAAGIVQEHTDADSILHTPGMRREFAMLMGFLADRRIEMGGWEETRPDAATLKALRRHARQDWAGSFVTRDPDDIPPGRAILRAGSLYVGVPP